MSEILPVSTGMLGRIAIIVAQFNPEVTHNLQAGVESVLIARGYTKNDFDMMPVAGAFELPIVAKHAAESGRYAGVIALGCVIQGKTQHFDFVAGEAASGIQRVALDTGIPVALGVLTTHDQDQALARAGGRLGNKGEDVTHALLDAISVIQQLGE